MPKLGRFIEAEKVTHGEIDSEEIVHRLWNLLNELGVNKEDEVFDGYDVMLDKLV